ncbi:MAG: 50S ribosomal protein L10 [Candidatus Beckwithbacteria bacterium]|nr:50S ribosomal protein L10 [Candidatus Beckwithbacteria bacterium]
MPSQQNLTTVSTLAEKLQKSKSVVLSDYRGLTVNQQRQLRNQVKAVNAELIVAKNSLISLALKAEKYSLPASLTGPVMILFAYEDEIAPIKVLAEFAKTNELPKIKLGFLAKKPLTDTQVNQLASLPTKVELLAKTVGTLKSPLYGIVNVLAGNIRKLVYAISAIAKVKADKGVKSK